MARCTSVLIVTLLVAILGLSLQVLRGTSREGIAVGRARNGSYEKESVKNPQTSEGDVPMQNDIRTFHHHVGRLVVGDATLGVRRVGPFDANEPLIETVEAFATVKAVPDRFSSRWLQPNQTLFCTSFDNDTATMNLQFERSLRRHVPLRKVHVRVDGCPNTVALYVTSAFPLDTLIVPAPRLSRRKAKASLSQRPVFLPRPLLPLRSAPVKLVLDQRQFRIIEELQVKLQHNNDHPSMTSSQHLLSGNIAEAFGTSHGDAVLLRDDQITGCLTACLASPCCTAFQANNTATRRSCILFTTRHDESAADAPGFLPQRLTFLLAQRREFRPSLVDDSYRLNVYDGPGPVEALGSDDDAQCRHCLDKRLEVRLDGRFGVLQHVGYFAQLRAVLVDADHGDAPVGEAVVLHMRDGVANASMRSFGSLAVGVGRRLCVVVSLLAEGGWTDADGTPRADSAVVAPPPARVCTIVGVLPAEPVLRFGGAQSGFPASEYVSRDPEACAPYLRSTECCIRGFWYRLEDKQGRRSVPTWRSVLGTTHFDDSAPNAPRTSLVVVPRGGGAPQCEVSFVEGYYSIANRSGEGSFPNLVVDVRGTCTHTADDGTSGGLRVRLEVAEGTLAETVLPWEVLDRCRNAALLVGAAGEATLHSTGGRVGSHSNSRSSSSTPSTTGEGERHPEEVSSSSYVGFSVRANRELEFLRFQLATMFTFAPSSVVALHLSFHWKLTPHEKTQLNHLNASHPRTLVNPIRVRSSSYKATHIHAVNFKMLLRCGFHVSHVVIWAANELLVRSGLEQYVRQFDMSAVDRMIPSDGQAYAHNMHHIEWKRIEEHSLILHNLWPWMPWDGVAGELVYAGILKHRRVHEDRRPYALNETDVVFPTHQLLLEGTFFNRTMAQEFIRICEEDAPLQEYCTTSGQYSDNEIFPFLIMKGARCGVTPGLRCGGRVSTMLWRDFLYIGTIPALAETRCSPFHVPFGWKRVQRNLGSPVVTQLKHILMNETRSRLLRDDNQEFCTQASYAFATTEKWRLRAGILGV